MPRLYDRREFLRYLAGGAMALVAPAFIEGCGGQGGPTPVSPTPTPRPTPTPIPTPAPSPSPAPQAAEIALARGKDWEAITRAAVEAIGGMGAYVKPGDVVFIKPNICTAGRPPEYAATAHPIVVATIARMCWEAGARKVQVFDLPFSGTQEAAYRDSGIIDALRDLDVEMLFASPRHYEKIPIPEGRDIREWTFYRPALEADVFINVPIAKHHGLAGLTLGMKNVMGVIQDRPRIHWNIHQRIADLNSALRSHLVVVDATRILVANGPQGGRLEDVRVTDTVIASWDVVAADALAATLFGKSGHDIGYISAGANMGLGLIEGRRLMEIDLGEA